jgi:hypothetical protein
MIQRALMPVFPVFYSRNRFYLHPIDVWIGRKSSWNKVLMMGLHPTYVKDNYLEELTCKKWINKRKFYAVGEIESICIGTKPICSATNRLKKQIHSAKQYKLLIVIHCREAFDEILKFLGGRKIGIVWYFFIVLQVLIGFKDFITWSWE